MTIRQFSLVLGIIFIIIGLAGFVPAFVQPAPVVADDPLVVDTLHGRLFGLFPVNWLHNLVHLAFGIWGVAAWKGMAGGAVLYSKTVAIIYVVLAVMGFIPVLRTTFGLIPLYGNDIWLHLIIAAAAAYFGWMHKDTRTTTTTTHPRT